MVPRRVSARRGLEGPRHSADSIPHAGPEDDAPAEVGPFRVTFEPAYKVVRIKRAAPAAPAGGLGRRFLAP